MVKVSKPKATVRNLIILIIFAFPIFTTFVVIFVFALLYLFPLLFDRKIVFGRGSNNNEISIPQNLRNEMKIYDLQTFLYRNTSLYRYIDDQHLILNERGVGEIERVIQLMNQNERFMSLDEHEEEEYEFKEEYLCSGRCECYENEILGRYRRSELVYTQVFQSVPVFSTNFELAMPSFIDDFLGKCYKAIGGMFGTKEDYDATCSMEEPECYDKLQDQNMKFFDAVEGEEDKIYAYCFGNCEVDEKRYDKLLRKGTGEQPYKKLPELRELCRSYLVTDEISRIRVPRRKHILQYKKAKSKALWRAVKDYVATDLHPKCRKGYGGWCVGHNKKDPKHTHVWCSFDKKQVERWRNKILSKSAW